MMVTFFLSLLRYLLIALGLVKKPELVAQLVSEQPAPESVAPGVVYIVGSPDYQKWAVFRCPDHESEIIQLSLMPNRRPRWTVQADFFGRPTIHPSVRRTDGSLAHFWVRAGRIEWCADSGRSSAIH
jgi:hypothetical protein